MFKLYRPGRRATAAPMPRASLTFMFTLLILLGSLAAPLLPSVAADTLANDARMDQALLDQVVPLSSETAVASETATETETVVASETATASETVTASETAVASETAAASETVTTQNQGAGQTVNVIVNVFWCPAGTNPDTVPDGQAIGPGCTLQGDTVRVVLSGANGNSFIPATQVISTFPGIASYENLEANSYAIAVHTNAEHKSGMFCIGNTPYGNTKPYARVAQLSALDLIPEETITCDWFGELLAPGNGTTVTIYKWECPPGTMFGDALSYYEQECDTEKAGVPFEVTDTTGKQQTTSDTNGRQVNNLQGQFTIKEKVPTGYGPPAIFCKLLNDAQSTDYSSGNGSVTLPPSADDDYQCHFFNIPDDGMSVTIYKWECPPGTLTGQPFSYYSGPCDMEQAGVPFEVTDASGTQQTTSDTNGRDIDGLYGDVTITETVPTGFGTPAIFCQLLNGQPGQEITGTGNSVTVPPSFDDDYQCFFYNIPGVSGGPQDANSMSVTIYKRECIPGTLTGQTQTYYQGVGQCETERAGVPFGVTDDNGTQQTTSDTNGRQIDNLVGQVTIQEMIMGNWEAPAIFCQLLNGQPGQEITGSGGSVTLPFVADDDYQCWFYNIPTGTAGTGPGDVLVYKFACASTPPANSDYAWYFQNCTTAQNGVTFVLDTPSVDIQTNTGDSISGAVMMGGVNAGMYPLTETVPPQDYQVGAVFCATVGKTEIPGPAQMMPQQLSGNSITATVTADMLFFCHWYNVPVGGDGTTVTIYKWECDDGTMYGQAHSYYSAECDTEQPGVPFEVTDTTGTQQTTSDTNGRQISGLQGQFTIREMVPTGYGSPAIFCQLLNDAQATDYSATSPAVTLPSNTTDDYQCFFYNIPDDGTSVTIYKWECDEGTMFGDAHSYYSAECDMEQPGVPFEVTDSSGTQQTTSDTNGRQIDGLYGQITITELVPTGYGNPAIFCQLLNDPQSTDYSSTSPSVTLPPAMDDDYQCFFYNIPDDGTSVTIYKWECPPTTTYGHAHSYYSGECDMEQAGVPFEVTDNSGTQQTTSDTNGRQIDGLYGQITIREIVPPGWGNPVIFCQLLNDPQSTDYSTTSPYVMLPPSFNDDYQCFFYNIPEQPSTVTIYKWECPQGQPADTSQTWFETNCTTPMDGVVFNLTDAKGPRSMTTMGGMVEWTDVSTGAVKIDEQVPPGYSKQPYVVCQLQNATIVDDVPATINGTWNLTIDHGGMKIVCHWYNWYLGPGEITVYKWTCPEGYDRTAWGADPMKDCTQATNDVTFRLDQPDPEIDLESNTGDSINGAVYFGGLMPGNYVLTEMISPGSMQDVFVWQCYGLNTSAVQIPPLSVGQEFNFPIAGGDKIECHWFNVPYPQQGWMVVTKFNCTTEKYVADVYCYTNQTGQEFNLQKLNGSTWETVQSGTTNVSGQLTFNDLEAGDYKLVEPNGQACLMKSSNITPGGNIGVTEGEGTTVHVYNCKAPPPPQTGKTPTKYPNTGVAPVNEQEEQNAPGIELAGLLALAGLQVNRRRMLKGAALIAVGTATALPLARAQELVPLDSTPVPGTPDPSVFGCDATPGVGTPQAAGTPGAAGTPSAAGTPVIDPCNRGAIPQHIRIPVIEVDAAIEYLEIIDGEMQPPSGATDVAWYKETSRLGEVGNGVYSGHLNFWDVPEGVFFRLESLKEGDIIELDGDDGRTYLYQVQWMENFPIDEEPPDEALGFTDEVAITLITCGGEWDAEQALYDHRTLARAVMLEA